MRDLESKQQIFETAKELFYREGYVATTMRKIAQQSGVSLGLPIYYFKSKENLGVEIYRELRHQMVEVCRQIYPLPGYAQESACLSTVADNTLLVTNIAFRSFYKEIAFSNEMLSFMYDFMETHYPVSIRAQKVRYLNSLTVASTKANLANADRETHGITEKELIYFIFLRYLRMQLPELSPKGEEVFQRFYQEVQCLDFRLSDRFTLTYNQDYINQIRRPR